MIFESNHSLFLRTGVQLIVSYIIIEVQVIFKILLVLIASQLAIVGQLEREVLSRLKVMDFTYFHFLSYFYFLLFSILKLSVRVICDITVMLSYISHSYTITCHNGKA